MPSLLTEDLRTRAFAPGTTIPARVVGDRGCPRSPQCVMSNPIDGDAGVRARAAPPRTEDA